MNATPAALMLLSPSSSCSAAAGAYETTATSPASQTNGRPPRACLAKKFHDAWAIAAAAMRARAAGLRG
jgi:hypothetical protein